LLHTPSSIYVFEAEYCSSNCTSVFPCQYHSKIAPYSFIHLPTNLYNFLPMYIGLPMSVLFHNCSKLIHSFTTTPLYKVFQALLHFSIFVSFHHWSILIH
jgi:hypothetical protein